jgi:membrane protease YdiL (CAAX protease family)
MKIYKAFLHTIFLVGLQALIGITIFLIFQLIDKNNNNYYVHGLGLFRTFAQLSGFLIFSYFFWQPWNNWIKKPDLEIDNFKIISLLFIIGIGYELIKSPFVDFNNILKYINQTDSIYNTPSFDGLEINLIYRVIGVIIIAPVIEELFFRKYLIIGLLEDNSKTITLIISSICFSLIHFETPNNLIPAFLFGLASGLIYTKTKKIGYSILLHLIVNSLWVLDVVSGYEFYNYLQRC